MIGVLGFASIAVWFALSLWIAWRAARLVKQAWRKALVILAVAPLLFVAPVTDELIGKYQYERYCKEAEEVKIYGTIPVGEEFYTADGKWKMTNMSRRLEERNRLADIRKSLIRWDDGTGFGTEVSAAIPIQYWETRIYEVKTGRPLAGFRIYGSRGGWLSRMFLERAALMPAQCFPRLLRDGRIEQVLLPYSKNAGGEK